MKKIIYFFILIGVLFSQKSLVLGQTPTASATPKLVTPTIDKQIQNLKDKIANKVAEMRKKDERAISGVISEIKDGIINFQTLDDQSLNVKTDDSLTKIYLITGSVKKEQQLSDLKKDDYIIVTGPILDKTISANFIYQDEQYLVKTGKITEVNKTDYYLKVLSSGKDNYTLDFETYTKTSILNSKTGEIEKIGFSKIKEGDIIHFVIKKNSEEKEKNRFPASKILIIPQEYFVK